MKSSILIGLLASASAFAAGSKSSTQQLYQPNGGQSAAEVEYKTNFPNSHDVDTYTGVKSYDKKQTLSDWLFSYNYGFSDDQTVGANISYGSDRYDQGGATYYAVGFSDLDLNYLGKTDFGGFGLYYGLNFNYALEHKKSVVLALSNPPGNRTNGGMSLDPMVGVLGMAGAFNYGLTVDYTWEMVRTVSEGVFADAQVRNGDILKAVPFVEYNYGLGIGTLAIPYVQKMEETTTLAGNDSSKKARSYWGVELGGTYDFTDMITGIVRAGYYMYPSHDIQDATNPDNETAYNDITLTVGARFTF